MTIQSYAVDAVDEAVKFLESTFPGIPFFHYWMLDT